MRKSAPVSLSPKQHPRWLIRLLAGVTLLAGFLLLLVALEGVARRLRPDLAPSGQVRMTQDPLLGWRFDPSQEQKGWSEEGAPRRVRINALGFADRDHPLQPAPGTLRIAVLGDSFTAAVGVDFEESFPRVMEAALRRDHPEQRWEVLNFGVPSFGTVHELRVWKHTVSAFRPQIVLLAFFLGNDTANNLESYEPAMEERRSRKRRSWFYRTFLEPSVLYQQYKRAERDLRRRWKTSRGPRISAEDSRQPFWKRSYAPLDWQVYWPDPDPEFEAAWKTTEECLRNLRREVEASGAQLRVALLPGAEAVLPEEFRRSLGRYPGIESFRLDTDYPRRRLLDFLRRENIPAADLQAVFLERAPEAERAKLYLRFDRHFSPAGHRLAGETLARTLAAGK